MKTTLTATEIAVLRYYASTSFDTGHACYAHPGLVAQLVQRGYLRASLGSFQPTKAGEVELEAERIVQASRTPIHAYSPLCRLAYLTQRDMGYNALSWSLRDRLIARVNDLATMPNNAWV